jgi:hypothetical protein
MLPTFMGARTLEVRATAGLVGPFCFHGTARCDFFYSAHSWCLLTGMMIEIRFMPTERCAISGSYLAISKEQKDATTRTFFEYDYGKLTRSTEE